MKTELVSAWVKGFSFIELILVLVLLGVIAGLTYPLLSASAARHKEAALQQALLDIRQAIDAYHADVQAARRVRETASGYPPNLEALLEPRAAGAAPYLRALPPDPFFTGEYSAPAKTWKLRSYQSRPGEPNAGADVFDVLSTSQAVGSNGIPYSKW